MAESNALLHRRQQLQRDTALATAAAYAGLFDEGGGDGLPATYQARLSGWTALAFGSARDRLCLHFVETGPPVISCANPLHMLPHPPQPCLACRWST